MMAFICWGCFQTPVILWDRLGCPLFHGLHCGWRGSSGGSFHSKRHRGTVLLAHQVNTYSSVNHSFLAQCTSPTLTLTCTLQAYTYLFTFTVTVIVAHGWWERSFHSKTCGERLVGETMDATREVTPPPSLEFERKRRPRIREAFLYQ